MKKILSILVMLALVSGVAFAQLTPAVQANAAVNWGIDLGAGKDAKPQHGFENYLFAQVIVPLYTGKLSSKTEGDVHVEFNLGANLRYGVYEEVSNTTASNLKFALLNDTLSSMTASVHFFEGYLTVYGRPNFSTNFAKIWNPISGNARAKRPQTSGDITGFGTKIGYASKDLAGTGISLDTGIKLASNGSWQAEGTPATPTTPAKPAVQGKYALGWDLSFGYQKWVSLDLGVNATFAKVKDFVNAGANAAAPSNPEKPYLGFGFKLGSKPVEGLSLSFAGDMLLNVGKDNKLATDLIFDVGYKWVSFGVYYGNKYSAYTGKDKDNKPIGDMAMKLAFESEGDLVENLNFGVDFRLNHLLNHIPDAAKKNGATIAFGLSTWIDYTHFFTDAMWIRPYTEVYVESNHKARADGTTGKDYIGVAYNLGVVFAPIEKLELSIAWDHGKLNWNKYEGPGMIDVPANHRNHNGTLVLGAKITY